MIRFFQKAKGKDSYCQCEQKQASHFSVNGGDMQPIGELRTANISNLEAQVDNDREPLPMPAMNFSKKENEQEAQKQDDDNVLPLPSL